MNRKSFAIGIFDCVLIILLFVSCQTSGKQSGDKVSETVVDYVYPKDSDGKYFVLESPVTKFQAIEMFHWISGTVVELKTYTDAGGKIVLGRTGLVDCSSPTERTISAVGNTFDLDGNVAGSEKIEYDNLIVSPKYLKLRLRTSGDLNDIYEVEYEVTRALTFEGRDNEVLVVRDDAATKLLHGTNPYRFEATITISKYKRHVGLVWRGFYDKKMASLGEYEVKEIRDHL